MLAHLMSSQGPLARSVADVRLALEVMSQRDPRDPWWVPAPLAGPKPKGPIKVALAKLPEDMEVDPSVRAALRQAADHLERRAIASARSRSPTSTASGRPGATSSSMKLRCCRKPRCWRWRRRISTRPGAASRRRPSTLDLAGWMRATAARNGHIRAWQLFFEDYPVVLAPTTVKPTPGPREDAVSEERVRAKSSGTTCASFPRSMCWACPARSCRWRCTRAGRSACN